MAQNVFQGGYRNRTCAIILLVGRTNAGKSTFIKHVTGKSNDWDTGTEDSEMKWLISRTVQWRDWSPDPVRGHLFVELPCFTDNFGSDRVILLRVANALKQLTGRPGDFIGGTVYLHDCSKSDAAGDIDTLTTQLRLVSPILGPRCVQSSIPVLSKTQEVDDARKRRLQDRWNHFFAGANDTIKLYRNEDDPRSIVEDLLHCPKSIVSLMDELKDGKKKMLKDTAVGKRYQKELEAKIDNLEKGRKRRGIGALMKRSEDITEEERALKDFLKAWKDCHFPRECTKERGSKVCRGACWKKLHCSRKPDCPCGTHARNGF